MITALRTIEELERSLIAAAQATDTPSDTIDWNEKKNRWVASVNDLYAKISEWCQPINGIKISKFTTTIQEKYMGAYEIEKLNIAIAGKNFIFVPVGTSIIRAFGRVDVLFENTVSIVVSIENEERSFDWYFVGPTRKNKTIVDRTTFLSFMSAKLGV